MKRKSRISYSGGITGQKAIEQYEKDYGEVSTLQGGEPTLVGGMSLLKTGRKFGVIMIDGQVEIPRMRELRCECKRKVKLQLAEVLPAPLWLGRCPRCKHIQFITASEGLNKEKLTELKLRRLLKVIKKGGVKESEIQNAKAKWEALYPLKDKCVKAEAQKIKEEARTATP